MSALPSRLLDRSITIIPLLIVYGPGLPGFIPFEFRFMIEVCLFILLSDRLEALDLRFYSTPDPAEYSVRWRFYRDCLDTLPVLTLLLS